MEDERRREIALFRYALIRQAADDALSPAQRGRLVRDLAARDHQGPDIDQVLDYPYLEREDVLAALEYAAAVVDQRELPLARPA